MSEGWEVEVNEMVYGSTGMGLTAVPLDRYHGTGGTDG